MEYRRMGKSGLQLRIKSCSWVTFHKQINDGSADELMGIAYDNGIIFSTMQKPMHWVKAKR